MDLQPVEFIESVCGIQKNKIEVCCFYVYHPVGETLILVNVRDNEPFEKAMRRFRRKVEREGIRKDIKKNSFYLKPGEKRRLKQRLAEKRRRKAMRRAMKRTR